MNKLAFSAFVLVLVAALVIPAIMPAAASACTDGTCGNTTGSNKITLTGTIRDFKAWNNPGGHSDFGVDPGTNGGTNGTVYAGYQVVYGLVNSALLDGTPDLSNGDHWAAAAITSSASFKQWYTNNVYNMSMPYSMTLTEKSPGSQIYVFAASPFFPIDDQLFGNEGQTHNYHFTLQLHTDFTYTQMTGRTLDFYSDDDLWVFIDGKLEVDLGGVHANAYQSIVFDDLHLSPTGTHTFDLFFAERHVVDSQLCATVPAPEASTIILLSLGVVFLGGFVWYGTRRRKVAA